MGDKGGTLLIGHHFYAVTHGHGIGAADALQSEVALDFAVNHLALPVGFHGIPTARILDD